MHRPSLWAAGAAAILGLFLIGPLRAANVNLDAYRPGCEVKIEPDGNVLRVVWPLAEVETGELVLDLSGRGPLIQKMVARIGTSESKPILTDVDPAWFLTIGSRKPPADKPPAAQWEVFFDNPHQRPHEVHVSKLTIGKVRVTGSGSRATIAIEGLAVGPFAGSVELSFYAGSRLLRIDAVITTQQDRLAVFYDQGLVAEKPTWEAVHWMDTEGKSQKFLTPAGTPQRAFPTAIPLKVRHRTIVVEGAGGSLACFPPPHQFQFPRDYSTNLGFVWHGAGYQGQTGKTGVDAGVNRRDHAASIGFGIRQNKDGGGNYVPWFNAPPNVPHRMGMFCLLTAGTPDLALEQTLKFTHGDRFPELPGYKTFTSHYHMAIAVTAMEERAKGINRKDPPDYVGVFKNMGVNMVHLGEFHGDGHPKDPGPLRLPEMQAMFDECRRWSDERLLLIPGEEGNDFLGLKITGKHPGHWMSLFPRPVYWTMTRAADQPFLEEHPKYGRVYHVGDRADMTRLVREERGLIWSAHPRIKASSWTPDIFRDEDFYLAESWLGGAWKAMPGDLSREKQGERVLNLLDDMANWGQKKYALGEVDVFKIDHTHELYGHMNVNYVQMDRVPKYDAGWQPVLDVLRAGRFFVTTGEILIPKFTVGGQQSGDNLKYPLPAAGEGDLRSKPGEGLPELVADLQWTFPLSFAEVISGDGQKVYRERIDLTDTGPFGTRTLKLKPNLTGRHWVRLEIWDIAANGAFTQPVWIE